MSDPTAKPESSSVEVSVPAARKRHIAVVGHQAGDELYGGERSLLDVLAGIDRRRYEVSCIFPNENAAYLHAAARYAKNITVFPYRLWNKARPFDEDTVSRFEEVFRSGSVDLVHVNTITLADPLLAARRLGLPNIVHARELVDRDAELVRHFGYDASTVVRTIRNAADFIIANSDVVHRLYRKETGRSFRLYNSVDIDRLNLVNDFEPGRLKVGIISSNGPKKGIEHFVKLAILASRRRPELEFLVIGPRNEHTDALARVTQAERGAPNLRFVGYVAEPVEAIRQVNVVVSFSIVAESFGRTIAEAMSARRPVIAYSWGATPELIRDGTDGFLIPYLDYAKALDHLGTLADQPDRVREMGANGRQRAEALFSPAVFAANLNEIYRQVFGTWKTNGDGLGR